MTDGRAEAGTAHLPVLFTQVMHGLRVDAGGTYLDGTFGRGGHARGILEQLGTKGRLLLMDKDPEAIAQAEADFGGDPRVAIRRGSFADLATWQETEAGLDGVLFDLGVSSPQLDDARRGFSFRFDGPLDMRMDNSQGESAAVWLARADADEIADVLWTYGEERMSRRIAKAIVASRVETPITRTTQLAELIASIVGRGADGSDRNRIHPATRSFQGIRIFINRELDDIEAGLAAAHARLRAGGRLAVISFHSLEDRIVKRFIATHSRPPSGNRRLPMPEAFVPTLRVLTSEHRVDQRADAAETMHNPRARSAVLRVAERLP